MAWFERTLLPATLDLAADKLQALWEGREALLNHTLAVKTLDGRDLTVILSMMVPSAATTAIAVSPSRRSTSPQT